MLFKNYLYLDESLLQKLSKQVGIKISSNTEKITQTSKKADIGISRFSGGAESAKTDKENFENDKYDLLRLFEEKLNEDETACIDFEFDEAGHICPGQLICFSARMLEPESEGNIELINSIKANPLFTEMLKSQIDLSNQENEKIMDYVLKFDSNIPIYFSNDEKYIVVSEINKENLDCAYEEFQEFLDTEVNVVLLVERIYSEEQDVIMIDIMKDIFGIGRNIRRTMKKEDADKYIVKEKGPALKGKILAIYN